VTTRIPVLLSSSSVFPEPTAAAFEMAATVGYDGLEVMVWTDAVSQDVGALQGLAPGHVVYAGTVSKTLAPALRLGWLVVPPPLLDTLMTIQHLADNGRSRLEQHVMAEFITSGDFDRHLRKMRAVYRDRRAALLDAVAHELPAASVGGVSAGLHACVALPRLVDETAVMAAAARRGIEFNFMTPHFLGPRPNHSTMLLSYARLSESEIRAGVRGLKAALENT